MQTSQNEQARALFVRALGVRPDYAFAHAQLGALDLSENQAAAVARPPPGEAAPAAAP